MIEPPAIVPAQPPAERPAGVADGLLRQLDEFREMFGAEMVEELLSLFITDTPERITLLRRAVGLGEAEEVRRVAHAIKGSSATMGMEALAAEAAALEEEARAGNLDRAEQRLNRILTDYQAIEGYARSLGIRAV